MTLPPNQKTGVLSELDVSRIFMSWGWNVGQDRIDNGYDLFVAPDHKTYKGNRFLVQVKGTVKSSKSGSIRASVSKNRLREYAESTIPVFIVRATPEGVFYWTHAQPWCHKNEHRITDQGHLSVNFERGNTLANRQEFERYLKSILELNHQKSMKHRHPEFLHSYSKADISNSKASPNPPDLPENIKAQLSFTPTQNQENIEKTRDAFYFGLPAKISVDNFNITGLPTPDNRPTNFSEGTIILDPVSATPGNIRLIPREKRNITSTELKLDAEIFSGTKGFAASNVRLPCLLDICIKFLNNGKFRFIPTAKIGFRMQSISEKPVKDSDYLSQIYLWAEQSLKHRALTLELDFSNERFLMPSTNEFQQSILDFLLLAYTLGKIHLIARTTESPLCVPVDFSLTRDELEKIDRAFYLLKGDRHQIATPPTLELEPTTEIKPTDKISVFSVKFLTFNIFNQELCRIPAKVELIDFQARNIPDSSKLLITAGKHGKAWISYADDYSEDLEGAWFAAD